MPPKVVRFESNPFKQSSDEDQAYPKFIKNFKSLWAEQQSFIQENVLLTRFHTECYNLQQSLAAIGECTGLKKLIQLFNETYEEQEEELLKQAQQSRQSALSHLMYSYYKDQLEEVKKELPEKLSLGFRFMTSIKLWFKNLIFTLSITDKKQQRLIHSQKDVAKVHKLVENIENELSTQTAKTIYPRNYGQTKGQRDIISRLLKIKPAPILKPPSPILDEKPEPKKTSSNTQDSIANQTEEVLATQRKMRF